ncbi:Pentatricopeptide repeat-containing protein At5g43790 [Linum grandiflorum]
MKSLSVAILSAHPTLQLLERCNTFATLRQVHAQLLVTGLALHTYPLSRLLFVSSASSPAHTLRVFDQIPDPTIFLFNTVISCFSNLTSRTHIAFSLYHRALRSYPTVTPNSFTYPSLFKACRFHPWVPYGLALHTHVFKFLEPPYDQFVQSSLLNYYANCGKLNAARRLFDRIRQPDLASWNSILAVYARRATETNDQTDISLETLHLFREMQNNSSVRPNEVTLVAVITACSNLGALSQGAWAHLLVLKTGLRLNRYVGTALVELYSKSGRVDLARQVFDQLPQRDILSYNAMIGCLAIHGYGLQALDLYEKMELQGLTPDSVTFIVAMVACSHTGLVEQGEKIFQSIKEVHGIEPTVEHYGCVVDLLIRAGRLKEAEEKVRSMPMKANAAIWRSLLAGARIHGDLQLGEMALKQLVQLEPEKSGSYVLLSNMYASTHKWEQVKRVREVMKEEGIVKFPGSSIVEIHGAMHEFISGDRTHPLSSDIYAKVQEMNTKLQEHGYNPRTREVLFDIEDEEKEDALSYHSERLAIAFAMLVAADSDNVDAPVRIIKNLRVCGDCHDSFKLISVIYRREIIVRDRSRFHHFRDGICSCLDY